MFEHPVFAFNFVDKVLGLGLGLAGQVVLDAKRHFLFVHLLSDLRNVAFEVRNNIFALLHLSLCDFCVARLKLPLLVLVVAGHSFELLTHVVRPYVPVGEFSELGGVELVVEFVLHRFVLELLERFKQLLLKEVLHQVVPLLDIFLLAALNRCL